MDSEWCYGMVMVMMMVMMVMMVMTMSRNNCTYCGGGIEDNYPAAGALIQLNIAIVVFIIVVIMINFAI